MVQLKKIGYETNGREILSDISFAIEKNDRIGLVGRNGVGKTTLLRLLSGEITPTSGEIVRGGSEIGILPQNLSAWLDRSVIGFIEEVTGVKEARQGFEKTCTLLEKSHDDKTLLLYADALERYNRYEVADFPHTVETALAKAGIANVDADQQIARLSGGQRTRVALAAVIASKYDVVLLDEPTNNLDTKGVIVLEKFIGESSAAFVVVSHDRRFLRNATTRIIELMGSDKGIQQYGLGYDEYIECRQAARRASFQRYDEYEKEKKRLKEAAKKANMHAKSASGGRGNSDNDKLTGNFRKERAAAGLSKKASAMATRVAQLEGPEKPEEDVSLLFAFQGESEKSATLLSMNGVSISLHNDKEIGPFSLQLKNGERILISGNNGVGKSTLMKAIIGKVPLSQGTLHLNRETRSTYMDQDQSLPKNDESALKNLQYLAPHLDTHEAINLLIRFNLEKDVIDTTPARILSGGERAKVLLASIAANQANLLLLDEPTNNLDIPTVEALEKALKSFNGSVVMISHDRDFVESINPSEEIIVK
jgi:ATPase subunit of ABC transporter with duplicated ATPase domains